MLWKIVPPATSKALVDSRTRVSGNFIVTLKHVHIQFAHRYKCRAGWGKAFAESPGGGEPSLDLECLTHDKDTGVAAFGHYEDFAN